MKGIVLGCVAACAAACDGDIDTSMIDAPPGGVTDGRMADVPGGVGEPANLMGITMMHNQVRAMVDTTGVAGGPLPPMVWDPDLAALANAWASQCVDTAAPSGLVDHSSNSYRTNAAGYSYVGENIYGSGGAATAQGAVSSWASEKSGFTYPGNGCCGHYTQIVWRTSVNLGCANVTCNSLQYKGTILCNYGPGGNSGGAPY